MPRPISAPASTAGIASYPLSTHDEWELRAVTFTLDTNPTNTITAAFLDYRDSANQCIHLQALGYSEVGVSRYSLAGGAEPWYLNTEGTGGFPQTLGEDQPGVQVQRIPIITLTPQCSVNVYVVDYNHFDPAIDTIDQADPRGVVTDLHLWVEDVGFDSSQLQQVGPYMLVPGDQLGGVAA